MARLSENKIKVRVTFSPAPDAEERLRRLAALLLRPKVTEGEDISGISQDDSRLNACPSDGRKEEHKPNE